MEIDILPLGLLYLTLLYLTLLYSIRAKNVAEHSRETVLSLSAGAQFVADRCESDANLMRNHAQTRTLLTGELLCSSLSDSLLCKGASQKYCRDADRLRRMPTH